MITTDNATQPCVAKVNHEPKRDLRLMMIKQNVLRTYPDTKIDFVDGFSSRMEFAGYRVEVMGRNYRIWEGVNGADILKTTNSEEVKNTILELIAEEITNP